MDEQEETGANSDSQTEIIKRSPDDADGILSVGVLSLTKKTRFI